MHGLCLHHQCLQRRRRQHSMLMDGMRVSVSVVFGWGFILCWSHPQPGSCSSHQATAAWQRIAEAGTRNWRGWSPAKLWSTWQIEPTLDIQSIWSAVGSDFRGHSCNHADMTHSLDSKSSFHNNFYISQGTQYYYKGIPEFIQVGNHQFVEHSIVRSWIDLMLCGWWDINIHAQQQQDLITATMNEALNN